MSDSDTVGRPASACRLCPPPRKVGHWRPADDGYKTCSACLDRLREDLKEVRDRYHVLNPTPGQSGEHGTRGAPGFGSRAPASDHIIAMRDHRSGRSATTWRGSDGRFHQETETPVLSVFTELDLIAWHIVEARRLDNGPEATTVDASARFIDNHLDWLTRQDDIADHGEVVRALVKQLRPVTGEPGRRHIGVCPNVIDEGERSRECGTKLYAPLNGTEIECRSCGRVWPQAEWLRLGNILGVAS